MATASLLISTVVFACIGIQVGYCCNTTIAVQCMLDYWPPADIGTPRFNADLILSMANGNGIAADVICREATVVLEADVCLREALTNCDSAAFQKVQTENGWVVEKLSQVNQLAQLSVQIGSLCQGNTSPASAPVNNSTPGCENFNQDVSRMQACFRTISALSSGLRLDNVTAFTRTQLCTTLTEAVTCGNAIANTSRCEAVHARYQNQILPSFLQVQQLCIEADIEALPGCGNYSQVTRDARGCFDNLSRVLRGIRLDNVTSTERTYICRTLSGAVSCGNAITNTSRCEAVHVRYQNQILPPFQQVQQFCIEEDIEALPGCENYRLVTREVHGCFNNLSSVLRGIRLDNVTTADRTYICSMLSEAVTCGNAIANTSRCEAVHARYQNQILPPFQQVQQFCIEGDIEAQPGCEQFTQEIRNVHGCFNNVTFVLSGIRLDNVTAADRTYLCRILGEAKYCGQVIVNASRCEQLQSQYYSQIAVPLAQVEQFCTQGQVVAPPGCENFNQEIQSVYECFSEVSRIFSAIRLDNVTADVRVTLCTALSNAKNCAEFVTNGSLCHDLKTQYHNQILTSFSPVEPYCTQDVGAQGHAPECVRLTEWFFQCLAPLAPYSGIDLSRNPNVVPELCRQYPIVQQCQENLFLQVNQICPSVVTQRFDGVLNSQKTLHDNYCVPLTPVPSHKTPKTFEESVSFTASSGQNTSPASATNKQTSSDARKVSSIWVPLLVVLGLLQTVPLF